MLSTTLCSLKLFLTLTTVAHCFCVAAEKSVKMVMWFLVYCGSLRVWVLYRITTLSLRYKILSRRDLGASPGGKDCKGTRCTTLLYNQSRISHMVVLSQVSKKSSRLLLFKPLWNSRKCRLFLCRWSPRSPNLAVCSNKYLFTERTASNEKVNSVHKSLSSI